MVCEVSVIIPCWNYGRFLRECVQSALRQIRLPKEIFIMDDCSTDATATVGRQLAGENATVRYARQSDRSGPTALQNVALGMATGEYVMVLDADDYLEPTFIEKAAAALDNGPDVGIVYTDAWLVGELAAERFRAWRGREGVITDRGIRMVYEEYPEWEVACQTLKQMNFIFASALYRRVLYESGIHYRDTDRWNDWHFWREAVERGWSVHHVGEPLLCYRQHSTEQRTVSAATM